MRDVMLAVDVGGEELVAAQIKFRSACTHASDTARAILNTLAEILGAVAIFESNPIERHQRDVQAAAKHIAMSHNAYIQCGRAGLGLIPGPTF